MLFWVLSAQLKVMSIRDYEDQVVAFDLTSLKFAQRGPYLAISSAQGELLHMAEVTPETSSEAQFYEALRSFGEAGSVQREGLQYAIGLYDPYTQLMQVKDLVYRGRVSLTEEMTVVDLQALSGPLDAYQVAAHITSNDL